MGTAAWHWLTVQTWAAMGVALMGCSLLDDAKKAQAAAEQAAQAAAALAEDNDSPNPTSNRALAASGPIAGTYTISSASNPGGGPGYRGTVAITRQGPHYALDWTIAGSTPYKGVGIQTGNLLGVGWGMGTNYGVVVYRVNAGTLTGTWTSAQSVGQVGTEVLQGPAGLNGTYEIVSASNAGGGGTYTGTVNITPSGATHKVVWNVKPSGYSGVGILEGDTFIVGWGSGSDGAGVVAYRTAGTTLSGTWAPARGTQLGTEVLSKN